MPKGTIFMHTFMHSLFIKGEDGRFYQPKPETNLAPDTPVTYDVLSMPGAPPGFYFAENVKTAVVTAPAPSQSSSPPLPLQTPPSSGLGAWGTPLSSAIKAAPPPTPTPSPSSSSPKSKPVSAPALPVPSRTPPALTNKQTIEDFDAILNQVKKMKWEQSQGFGPSLQVTTKLRWEGEGKKLYLNVKDTLHDTKIPGTKMWYFVGTMGVNWGKGGFRISAHTHPASMIKKSTTYSVLHIEN